LQGWACRLGLRCWRRQAPQATTAPFSTSEWRCCICYCIIEAVGSVVGLLPLAGQVVRPDRHPLPYPPALSPCPCSGRRKRLRGRCPGAASSLGFCMSRQWTTRGTTTSRSSRWGLEADPGRIAAGWDASGQHHLGAWHSDGRHA
jgi:hypothetical protein